MCIFIAIRTETDGDKCACAVADHYSDSQRDNSQGEYNRIRCISITAEICSVGDEDLVYDVVKCCHQQGNNARNSI